MTQTRRIVLVIALSLAVVLAGCGAVTSGDGGDNGTAVDPSNDVNSSNDIDPSNYEAETLQQEAQASMQEVNSLTMEMDIDMEVDGQMGSSSISMEADGAANYETQRMHFEELSIDLSTPRGEQSATAEAYQIEDTMYIDDGSGWQSQPADDSSWGQDSVSQQSDLLEGADVSIEGTEVVNGENTLVVSVEPTDEALQELAGETAGSSSSSASSMEIESATVTQYIAAEDPHYVMKSEVDMVAVIDGQNVDMTMTITMDDHEEEVTIDVPDEIQQP